MPDERLRIVIEAIDKASAELKGLQKELEGVGTAGGKAASGLKKGADALGRTKKDFLDSKTALMAISGAATAAALALKKVYDAAQEGAAIVQTRESFDRLGVSIEQMRNASLNTVDDMTLMKSTLTLTAGASEELQSKLLGAAPQLMEIAKAANALNPTLGDTAFMYESIATGVKRGSPLILDNLGIMVKVGEANQRYADQLGKTVEQLTSEEKQIALLNETMRAGARLIEQNGGSVESATDSYAQLETNIQNITASMKVQASTAIGPLVERYNQFVQETLDADKKLIGFAATIRMVNTLMDTNSKAFYQYQKDAIDAQKVTYRQEHAVASLTGAMYAQIPGVEGITKKVTEYTGVINANDVALEQMRQTMGKTVYQIEEYVGAEEEVLKTTVDTQMRFDALSSVFSSNLTPNLETAREKLGELRGEASTLKDKIAELEGKQYLTGAQQEELAGLQTELGNVQGAIKGVISDTEKMMAGFVMNMAMSIVTADGLITESETNFTAALGVKLGLWDESYATMMRTTQEAHAAVEQGLMDETAAAQMVVDKGTEVAEKYTEVAEVAVPAMTDVAEYTGAAAARLAEAKNTANGLRGELDGLPRSITIDILINERRKMSYEHAEEQFNENMGYASGGTSSGGMSWVGERGPELVNLPRGAQVYDAQKSQAITNNNWNVNINTAATSGTWEQNIAFAQAMAQ